MSLGANLSLVGMYNHDDTLFSGMTFPDEFESTDKQVFINNVVLECAELELLYSDWDFLKFAINSWSEKEVFNWNRLYTAMVAEYNPIENYNRTENITVTNSGKDSVQSSGTDSVAASGKDTNQASGNDTDTKTGTDTMAGSGSDTDTKSRTSFENNSFANTEKIQMTKGSSQTETFNTVLTHANGRKDELTYGKTDTTTYGKKDETTYGHKITTTGNISGNIGVTTSQQMLEQEIAIIPKLNLIDTMIESFKNRFCLLVY